MLVAVYLVPPRSHPLRLHPLPCSGILKTDMEHEGIVLAAEGALAGPAEEGTLAEPAEEGALAKSAEFGHDNVRMVPLSAIIDLRQMRQEVDAVALEQLKERIQLQRSNGVLHFNLVHPVTINALDANSLQQYLKDHADYYGTLYDIRPEDLPTRDGKYIVRVAGHMRGRAVRSLCEENGIDPANARVSAVVLENIDFITANRTQNIENTHVKVSPGDDALAIERHYLWAQRHRLPSDYATIGAYFGYSRQKVHSALRFVTAPEAIKTSFNKGVLSYTNVVDLVRLREQYEVYYRKKAAAREEVPDSETVARRAFESTMAFFETVILKQLKDSKAKPAHINAVIGGMIRDISSTEFYTIDTLFVFDEDAERAQSRTGVRKKLVTAAAAALVYVAQSTESVGILDEETSQAMETLLARDKAARAAMAQLAMSDAQPNLF